MRSGSWWRNTPKNAEFQRDLANTQLMLGAALTATQPDPAREVLEQARDGWREMVAVMPGDTDCRRGLGSALALLGDYAEAAKVADNLVRRTADRAEACSLAARILAPCASTVAKGSSRPEAEHQKRSRTYADRAMAYVRKAVEEDLPDAAVLDYEPDVEALQGREDFRELMRNLARAEPRKP